MSDTTGLTDADYDELAEALHLEPPTPDAPMYYVIEEVVARIVERHEAQARRDGQAEAREPIYHDEVCAYFVMQRDFRTRIQELHDEMVRRSEDESREYPLRTVWADCATALSRLLLIGTPMDRQGDGND